MSIREWISGIFIDRYIKGETKFLEKISLFYGLSPKALMRVLNIVHYKKYFVGETVFSEGQEGKVLYIIKTGEVTVSKKNKIICKLYPGDFFGEMALLEEIPRSATVKVSKDSELLLVYKVKFDELLEDNAKIGIKLVYNLAKILSFRIRQTTG
ncbi:MAG: cyclic nucleotide-binding domain-containing protein [Elusimicrobiota bacterium]